MHIAWDNIETHSSRPSRRLFLDSLENHPSSWDALVRSSCGRLLCCTFGRQVGHYREKLSRKNRAEHTREVKNSCGTLCSKTLLGSLGSWDTGTLERLFAFKGTVRRLARGKHSSLQEPVRGRLWDSLWDSLGRPLVRKSWDPDG